MAITEESVNIKISAELTYFYNGEELDEEQFLEIKDRVEKSIGDYAMDGIEGVCQEKQEINYNKFNENIDVKIDELKNG